MACIVRRAGRRDLDAIQSLWELLRELQVKADSRLAPAAAAERLVAEHREVVLADPNTSFLVAEEQGEVLGFLHAQIEQGDPIYALERYGTIVDLFVLELRRGEGIGEQLLQSCLEWFRSLNLQEYRISTPVHTPEAQRFLEKHGALPLFVVQAAPLGDEE
jgi:GNAT superfamily N-acetyltransferase